MSIRVIPTIIPHSFAPINYPCHKCNAAPKQKCVQPDGTTRYWAHDGRGPWHPLEEEEPSD